MVSIGLRLPSRMMDRKSQSHLPAGPWSIAQEVDPCDATEFHSHYLAMEGLIEDVAREEDCEHEDQ